MHNWYDPITERWYKMPTQQKSVEIIEPQEDIYARADRLARIDRIWDAVVSVSSQ